MNTWVYIQRYRHPSASANPAKADADEIQGSPHWDNNFCKAGEDETAQKAANAKAVPIPDSDPVFGLGGPLVELWSQAAQS